MALLWACLIAACSPTYASASLRDDALPHSVDETGAGHRFVMVVPYEDPDDPYSARFVPASHFTHGRKRGIDTIVIHTMQGTYGRTIRWFRHPDARVSCHFAIRAHDGEITQLVHLDDTAWHGGNRALNQRSIGLELEGFVEMGGYPEPLYVRTALLTRWLADRLSIPLDREHIVGHIQVPGCPGEVGGGASCHTDPGDGWDWDHFMELVRATPAQHGRDRPTAARRGVTLAPQG